MFDYIVIGLVIINTGTLSSDHYPSTPDFDNSIDAINLVLTILFLIEMIMKIIGLGLREYSSNSFNVCDGTIVIVSILQVIAAPPPVLGGSSSNGSLSVLRSFRLMRLFRIFTLMSKSKKLSSLFNALTSTASEMQNFLILLFLFLYIYTLLGMQLFANKLRFNADGTPIKSIGSTEWSQAPDYQTTYSGRYNFDDFPSAFGCVNMLVPLSLSCYNHTAVML